MSNTSANAAVRSGILSGGFRAIIALIMELSKKDYDNRNDKNSCGSEHTNVYTLFVASALVVIQRIFPC